MDKVKCAYCFDLIELPYLQKEEDGTYLYFCDMYCLDTWKEDNNYEND